MNKLIKLKEIHHTITGKPIELIKTQTNEDSTIEIEINCKINLHGTKILFLLIIYPSLVFPIVSTEATANNEMQFYINLINTSYFILLIIYLYYLYGSIKCETISMVKGIGLHKCSSTLLGQQSHLFISDMHIHDIIINEVIYNLSIIYSLEILTKGSLYKKTPIITLLENIKPNVRCLEVIYKLLQTKV